MGLARGGERRARGDLARENDIHVGEVDAADDQADDRVDQVIDQRAEVAGGIGEQAGAGVLDPLGR